jgi:hypothetical protein
MPTKNVPARNGRLIQGITLSDWNNASLPNPANDDGPGKFPPATAARQFTPANTNAVAGTDPFRILKVGPDERIDAFLKVLQGDANAAHIPGTLSASYCDQVNERFEKSPLRRPRKDGVPGDEWGATQFGKTPSELAKLGYDQQGDFRDLIGKSENPISSFFRDLAIAAEKLNLTLRPAIYQGQPLVTMRAVRWTKSSGEPRWLLKLHDDLAQVVSARNEGFEIQQVTRLVAFNFYIRSKAGSGQLAAYNWKPTDADRQRIGVIDTGYPYSDGDIPSGTEKHIFDQSTGDLVVIDGSYVHGVLVGKGEMSGRLIVNGFAALLKDGTVALFA